MKLSEIIARCESEYEIELTSCKTRIERGHSDAIEHAFQNRKAVERYSAEVEYAGRLAGRSIEGLVPSVSALRVRRLSGKGHHDDRFRSQLD